MTNRIEHEPDEVPPGVAAMVRLHRAGWNGDFAAASPDGPP